MNIEAILAGLRGVRRNGTGWIALCPAHADKNPSLSINERDGKILFHCHAGCSQEAVLVAVAVGTRQLPRNYRSARRIVAEYDYQEENGELLFQVVRYEPKDFRQRRPNGKCGWTWKMEGVRRVPYRLPEVLSEKSLLICEGEKDCETARALGIVATCNAGGAGKWCEEYSEYLRGKQMTVIAETDAPGRKHAQQVARSLCGKAESIKLLELPGAKDLSEWVERHGTREALLDLIQSTPEWKPQALEGSNLLSKVFTFICRFVSLSESQARVVALWVVHTYVFSAVDATPYLAITSAEKQSGKTRLLEVLETIVANPWLTGRVTAAVLYRKIDAEQPTLLLDESDAAFGGEKEYAEALRGVLNTGHRRGGKSSCCVGQGANISFRDFSTFCPKAIAGIGKLPDTVADRAIPIRLKRAAPDEGIERFRARDIETEAGDLREQIESWSATIGEKLSNARPELPDALTDRQQDGAEPLLGIADFAGGEWPQFARKAFVELCAEAQASDDSLGVHLLVDIQHIFEARAVDRLSSAEIATALAEVETSPWSEWSHGKPLSAAKLARLLRPYGVAPHSIRIGDKTPKGYEREDFRDPFRRYLRALDTAPASSPAPKGATTQQFNTGAGPSDFSKRNIEADVAVQKCANANKNAACCGVALSATPAETEGFEEEI